MKRTKIIKIPVFINKNNISKLEQISDHVVVDKETQYGSRSCISGGISLSKYSIAIDSGDSLEVGIDLRKELG